MGSFLWLNHFSNSLHTTTSAYDPSAVPHSTVRLTNPNLRSQNSWHVVHWRPEEGSRFLELPDNEDSNKARKMSRKMRRQDRTQGQRGPSKDARSSREHRANQRTQIHATDTDDLSRETGPSQGTRPSQGATSSRGIGHARGSEPSHGTLPSR